MKHLLFIASALIVLAACNQTSPTSNQAENKDTATAATSSSSHNISIPYTPMYYTDFEFGDYKYAQTVFNLWKKYDDNDFTADNNIFADTIFMDFPDGNGIYGRDSLNNAMKKFRANLTSAKENVLTYVVLHPKGTDENWVSVWGNEIDTYKNGETDTTWMNENWKFNKEGKVAYISQYAAGKNLIQKK